MDASTDQSHYDDNTSFGEMNTVKSIYAPTFENLVHGTTSTSIQYDQADVQQFDQDRSYYTSTGLALFLSEYISHSFL
jgi:hypothetical protein